jgi:hypothetical protein
MTRSQRIRTAVQFSFSVAILETEHLPTYQRITNKALHLSNLGLSHARIAKLLEVTDKTVAKAIAWTDDQ